MHIEIIRFVFTQLLFSNHAALVLTRDLMACEYQPELKKVTKNKQSMCLSLQLCLPFHGFTIQMQQVTYSKFERYPEEVHVHSSPKLD